MNKDIIVLLLQKDIKELSLLTDGFEKMDEFPEPILKLARDKAENVLDKINELSTLYGVELEVVDYELFEDEDDSEDKIVEEETIEDSEKNNFDVPIDSYMELPVEPYEIEDKEPKELVDDKNDELIDEFTDEFDEYIEKEVESDNAMDEVSEREMDDVIAEESVVEGSEEVQLTSSEQDELQEVGASDSPINKDKMQPVSVFKDTLSVEDKSLTANLESQKIHDIRQAINIGDRFRFQRELFGGNGEVLNKTISYLNQLAKFSEAESFLKSKFGWADDNEHAEEFLQIVRRRYL